MKLIFRCDASGLTGLGHLSRSLALAEAWRRAGGEAVFLGHWSGAAFTLLASCGFPFRAATAPTGTAEDAAALAGFAGSEAADGVCVDSYAVDATWVASVAAHGVAVTLIDDFAQLTDYSACAGVLNFTVESERLEYSGLSFAQRALGPEYFPARENLRRARARNRSRASAAPARVLIALGGGDRLSLTMPLYHSLHRLQPGVQVRALLADGPARAAVAGLRAEDFPAPAGDLAEHYVWADACVTGGGLVKYECAYLGLPMAIISQTAEQQAETERFCAAGFGWDLAPGGQTDICEARLDEFLHRGARAGTSPSRFPADSADRAVAALRRFIHAAPVLTSS